MSRAYLGAALAWLIVATVLLAFEDKPAAPVFTISTTAGKPLEGSLRELREDGSLHIGDPAETRLAAADWFALVATQGKLPPLPTRPHLIFVNGDRIPFEELRLVGEKLFFKHPHLAEGKECQVPLTAVSVIWFDAPQNGGDPERLRRTLAHASRTRDQMLLRNGDVLEGILNALSASKAEVEIDKKPIEVALEKVAAIALGTEVVTALKPKGSYYHIVLREDGVANGTRLSLASASCADGSTLTGKSLFGSPVRVPLELLAALEIYQGPAVFLSDLKPAAFEFTSYLGPTAPAYPLIADGSVENRDLHLDGSTYEKGLGMHSCSRATYRLDGDFLRFESLVGLDDATGKRGRVRIRIRADGKPLTPAFDRELTARGGPVPVNIPVAGVKELTLEVDFGANGNRGFAEDDVDWCAARLIKRAGNRGRRASDPINR